VSRRAQIEMSDDEVRALLDEERTVICATNGRDGLPHLMPLWFVRRGDEVWAWTFGKSQKVRNLERDPRATLQVEAGESYEQLRGVMLKCDVVVHRDLDAIRDVGLQILERYSGTGLDDAMRASVEAQAPKRVGLQFVPGERATWDHRKLDAGVY
jgi:PPOX class probable F420-dependent enzyme